MSNLLEEAIIDANALRETALKSAENALIEKYKEEFKKSVNKLLEQEESTDMSPPEDSAVADPSLDTTSLGADGQTEAGGEALKDVPSSFLDGDDDEIITIDFDQLEKQISDALSSPMLASPEQDNVQSTDDQQSTETEIEPQQDLDQPQMQQLEEDLELTEEFIEEELELDEDLEEAYDEKNSEGLNIDALTEVGGGNDQKIRSLKDMIEKLKALLAGAEAEAKAGGVVKDTSDTSNTNPVKSGLEEDFEITEEEIQELAEDMKVDIEVEGLLDGHMGTHQGEKREVRNMELAAARDECDEDDREEELEKLGDLKKQLSESINYNQRQSNLIEELKDNLIVLKEQTEKLSISNAKLLYINKVFANNSLNERQKQNIVESISKSSSVLEAKTIFETLQSTVEGLNNKKSKESLSEALNRGNTVFSVRPKANQEEYTYSDRFKILAGIK